MTKVETQLKPEVIELLKKETIVSMITVDKDTKKPQLSVVSWVWPSDDGKRVKIAVGHKGSSVDNLQADPTIVLGTIGPETCYSIKGKASISDVISGGTMKYRVITVDIEEVEDVMFYGGKLTALPAYVKTYNAELAEKLDKEVYELLQAN